MCRKGIDVDDITHVINYQLPDEIETYTHRSGRTGRAGKTGVSMVIVSKSEIRKIKSIEKIIKKQFEQKDIPDGMEICQVQLMSLANKVHDTEINHEIEPYLNDIDALFEDTTKDELIKKFFSVEFTRFFNYYKKAKDLNVEAQNSSERDSGGRKSANETRYFINVGRKDGYDWMKLKDFLKAVLELGRDDVFKVDVKDSFSFFNTDTESQEKVLAFFTDFKYQGRFINVEVSEDRGSGKSLRRRSGGKRRNERPNKERLSKKNARNRGENSSKRKNSGPRDISSTRPRRSRRK